MPPKLDVIKRRVLCLHGFGQSASIFKSKTGALRKQFGKSFEFVFVDAPYRIPPPPNPAPGDITEFGRMWWERNEDVVGECGDLRVDSQGWARSLHYIANVWVTQGPFDGIFGFSQGAAMAGMFITALARGLIAVDGSVERHPHYFPSFSDDLDPSGRWATSRMVAWTASSAADKGDKATGADQPPTPTSPPSPPTDAPPPPAFSSGSATLDPSSSDFCHSAWGAFPSDAARQLLDSAAAPAALAVPPFAILVSGFLIRDVRARRQLGLGPADGAEPRVALAEVDAAGIRVGNADDFVSGTLWGGDRPRGLVVVGEGDAIIDPAMTAAFAVAMRDHLDPIFVLRHAGGHGVPQQKTEKLAFETFVQKVYA